MSDVTEKLRADVTRLLALMDHHEIVKRFREDWNVLDRSADAFEIQVDRVRHDLEELKNWPKSG